MRKTRLAIWGAVGVAAAGAVWFSANQAKPALPATDAVVVAAQKRATETIARNRLASATQLFRSAAKAELQGDLGRSLILYRQAMAGFLAVPASFPGSRAAATLRHSASAESISCAMASRKVAELTEVAGANPLWQFLWQASLRGGLPASQVIESLHRSQVAGNTPTDAGQLLALVKNGRTSEAMKLAGVLDASTETVAALRQMAELAASGGDLAAATKFLHFSWSASRAIGAEAGTGTLLASWSDRLDPDAVLRAVSAEADPAASGVLLAETVVALQAKGKSAQAEKLVDAAWSRVDADGRITAALALGRYRKALEASRQASDRARIAVAAARAGAFADLLPAFHRYYENVMPATATGELAIEVRELLAASQRPAALALAGDNAGRHLEAVSLIVADLLKSPDDEMLLGLGSLPGVAACRSWHEAVLARLQESPALAATLADKRGRTPPGQARDQLAILAMEQALVHDDLDLARNRLAEVVGKEERNMALERLAELLADRGAFLTVRQFIREQDPAAADGMWIALACGYAKKGSMADALKVVDEQVAGKESRQQALLAIVSCLQKAGRHSAAILTLSKLDDRDRQLDLIYDFAAQLYSDRDASDYATLKEMIKKYPVEAQVQALKRKWAGLRQDLAGNPARLDDPAVLALLQFCKTAYVLSPATWQALPAEALAEPYPFAAAEQAFEQLQKPADAQQLRRLVWQHGDAAVRQSVLEQMFRRDSFEEVWEQINRLPDAAEADRCSHRFMAMLKNARRYEEALALVAAISKRGCADSVQREAWLNEVREVAVAISSQKAPLTSHLEETVALIGNLLPPDAGTLAKPATPD